MNISGVNEEVRALMMDKLITNVYTGCHKHLCLWQPFYFSVPCMNFIRRGACMMGLFTTLRMH